MEFYNFRPYNQKADQILDEYDTGMRRLVKYCKFNDIDKKIISQWIQICKSNRLWKRALREPDKKLDDTLIKGRTIEISDAQASAMEKTETVNVVNKNLEKQKIKKTNTV